MSATPDRSRSFVLHMPEDLTETQVLVDGLDITPAVSEVAIRADSRGAVVELGLGRLRFGDDLDVSLARAQVEVDGATREVLLALGWTPPQVTA